MYRVIHGRLNSLTRNHGHRGAENGKELHKREADDRSCVDFQLPPRYATFQGRLQMWSFQGAPPGRERTKASGRAGAQVGGEVPEPWSERGRGTGEKWEGKP